VPVRPLHAHVVPHNVGSIRVLQKCGFRRDSDEEAHASGDGVEHVYVLRP
jgi:RimJ/RimL family protein N-acetyltransferase